MRAATSMLVCLMLLASAVGAGGAEQDAATHEPRELEQRYGGRGLVVGDWSIELLRAVRELPVPGPVTAMAFAPGRDELAYAATENGITSLWVTTIPSLPEEWWQEVVMSVRPRKLLQALDGRGIAPPIAWCPNGAGLAAIETAGDSARLIAIDYLSGEATTLALAPRIIDVAWHPNSRQVAYVVQEDGERQVWLQTVPPGEPRRIGEGGINLHWTLDGTLIWLHPESEVAWSERVWDSATGALSVRSSVPARAPGTLWSPDGTMCAALEPAERDGEMNLAICSASSTAPDVVPLPGVRPNRLLCWSSDSNIVVLLAQEEWLLAAAARPVGSGALARLRSQHGGVLPRGVASRLSLFALPSIDPTAGPPAWSSGGDLLAAVVSDPAWVVEALSVPRETAFPENAVALTWIGREYMKPPTVTEAERERVLSNVKNIALAMQMYLSDNDGVFPLVAETEGHMRVFDDYVRNGEIYMRPGTEDEVVVQFVSPVGGRWVDCGDVSVMPVVIADYGADFFAIGFGDGHAELLEATDENLDALEEWWAAFDALRAEDPSAPTPAFPLQE